MMYKLKSSLHPKAKSATSPLGAFTKVNDGQESIAGSRRQRYQDKLVAFRERRELDQNFDVHHSALTEFKKYILIFKDHCSPLIREIAPRLNRKMDDLHLPRIGLVRFREVLGNKSAVRGIRQTLEPIERSLLTRMSEHHQAEETECDADDDDIQPNEIGHGLQNRDKSKFSSQFEYNTTGKPCKAFFGGGTEALPAWGDDGWSWCLDIWDDEGEVLVYLYQRPIDFNPLASFRIGAARLKEVAPDDVVDMLDEDLAAQGKRRAMPRRRSSTPILKREEEGVKLIQKAATQKNSGVRTTTSPKGSVDKELPPLPAFKLPSDGVPVKHRIYLGFFNKPTNNVHFGTWCLATRNALAVIYDVKTLVGTSLYSALRRTEQRLRGGTDLIADRVDIRRVLIHYIIRNQFDVVHSSQSAAVALLAFSERFQWKEGYHEAFVYCAGMYYKGLQQHHDWKFVSIRTKNMLHDAVIKVYLRIHRAERYLRTFDFDEFWSIIKKSEQSKTAKAGFNRFKQWLIAYYTAALGAWPPPKPVNDEAWITYAVLCRLRTDFHALFNMIVNRDSVFDGNPHVPLHFQRWVILNKQYETADMKGFPFTTMVVAFDEGNNFPHLPYPYPKLPKLSVGDHLDERVIKHAKEYPKDVQREILLYKKRTSLVYKEATNFRPDLPKFKGNTRVKYPAICQDFLDFEAKDDLTASRGGEAKILDGSRLQEARLARWLIIYGVLQVLALIEIDNPEIRHKPVLMAQYHLNAEVPRQFPWLGNGRLEEKITHQDSHAFRLPVGLDLPGSGAHQFRTFSPPPRGPPQRAMKLPPMTPPRPTHAIHPAFTAAARRLTLRPRPSMPSVISPQRPQPASPGLQTPHGASRRAQGLIEERFGSPISKISRNASTINVRGSDIPVSVNELRLNEEVESLENLIEASKKQEENASSSKMVKEWWDTWDEDQDKSA